MIRTRVHFAWWEPTATRRFRTGVSLHSHTLHSREGLDFILRLAQKIVVVAPLVRRQLNRYRQTHNREFEAARVWWTPPLSPKAVYDLESEHIRGLNLYPLVSLSDHDNIDAPVGLRVLDETKDVPVSVEWTVPWGDTFFHLGVHNIAAHRAPALMSDLAGYTANPVPARLPELLEAVTSDPATLVVFNHCCWDEKGIGAGLHQRWMLDLLLRSKQWIHALELNGLRSFSENREVARLAEEYALPAISGGDRHAMEPNAILNLTNAATFSEFVEEVRRDGRSDVYFAAHYEESLPVRIYRNVCDVLRDDPQHAVGWTSWRERVFWENDEGMAIPLANIWPRGVPHVIQWFIALVHLLDNDRLAPALRGIGTRPKEMVW